MSILNNGDAIREFFLPKYKNFDFLYNILLSEAAPYMAVGICALVAYFALKKYDMMELLPRIVTALFLVVSLRPIVDLGLNASFSFCESIVTGLETQSKGKQYWLVGEVLKGKTSDSIGAKDNKNDQNSKSEKKNYWEKMYSSYVNEYNKLVASGESIGSAKAQAALSSGKTLMGDIRTGGREKEKEHWSKPLGVTESAQLMAYEKLANVVYTPLSEIVLLMLGLCLSLVSLIVTCVYGLTVFLVCILPPLVAVLYLLPKMEGVLTGYLQAVLFCLIFPIFFTLILAFMSVFVGGDISSPEAVFKSGVSGFGTLLLLVVVLAGSISMCYKFVSSGSMVGVVGKLASTAGMMGFMGAGLVVKGAIEGGNMGLGHYVGNNPFSSLMTKGTSTAALGDLYANAKDGGIMKKLYGNSLNNRSPELKRSLDADSSYNKTVAEQTASLEKAHGFMNHGVVSKEHKEPRKDGMIVTAARNSGMSGTSFGNRFIPDGGSAHITKDLSSGIWRDNKGVDYSAKHVEAARDRDMMLGLADRSGGRKNASIDSRFNNGPEINLATGLPLPPKDQQRGDKGMGDGWLGETDYQENFLKRINKYPNDFNSGESRSKLRYAIKHNDSSFLDQYKL